MKRVAVHFHLLLAILILTPTIASSVDNIPNAKLSITVQQKVEGEIDKGFHILVLSCWNGNCSLSSVSLNQCWEFGSGEKDLIQSFNIQQRRWGI